MGGVHVIGLAEGLLSDLPVAGNDPRHVGLNVERAQIPAFELIRQVLDERLEGFAVLIRIDEHEPGPGGRGDLRKAEVLLVHLREVPICRNVFQATVQLPGKAMERAAQL